MIKSGTRVSNRKGTGGFEFTEDYTGHDYHNYSVLKKCTKPYGNARSWGLGLPPIWFIAEVAKLNSDNYQQQPPLDYATESEHLISATFSQPPLDYAPKPIPVIYTRTINDVTYSIEDHEGEYAVYRAEVSDGEYFAYCIQRTRVLWWAKFMINVDRWLS